MKKAIFTLCFLVLGIIGMASMGYAQGNGNGNNGNWPPAPGQSSTACGVQPAIQPAAAGGVIQPPPVTEGWPMNKVVHILQVARPYFTNTNLGQMIQQYNSCSCVITYLGENRFRVVIGGIVAELEAEL